MKTKTKKPHWTQTPAGKAKLSRAMKRGWKAKHKAEKAAKTNTSSNGTVKNATPEIEALATAYALGRVDEVIAGIASRAGVPTPILAARVARLLDTSKGRLVLGATQ